MGDAGAGLLNPARASSALTNPDNARAYKKPDHVHGQPPPDEDDEGYDHNHQEQNNLYGHENFPLKSCIRKIASFRELPLVQSSTRCIHPFKYAFCN